MHAALIHLTINPTLASEAAAEFTREILPQVQSAPGFVGGYWLDPVDGEGFGVVLFEDHDQALAATPPATPWSAPGVKIHRVDIRRVAVAIPS